MKRILLPALLIGILSLSACGTTSEANGTLTVHFIDVGQGDSTLIDFGQTEVLIDGGGQES